MSRHFDEDPYPGRPKVLFIGNSASTHTHSWIDLLQGARINVRLFSLADGIPPERWQVKTYLTMFGAAAPRKNPYRRSFFPFSAPRNSPLGLLCRAANRLKVKKLSWNNNLARVIHSWRPDIIHTLGLDPASFLYDAARRTFRKQSGSWVVQVRGGPDLDLNRHLPSHARRIEDVISSCDQLIADNEQNYELLRQMGVPEERLAPLGVVPGTGGIDVKGLSQRWSARPSQRSRIIVCPKTYEAPSSKILPVFEALRLAWPRIRPCRIHLLWVVQPEIISWFAKLPAEIRDSCTLREHIPRAEALDLFLRARVLLAPSLTDGIPNSMLEAMACGAFPIVSPIDTLRDLVQSPGNTIFARNLYPDEIASALEGAMSDDALVDAAARRNLEFVGRQANRDHIRPRVIDYYETLAAKAQCQPSSVNQRPAGSGQSAPTLPTETMAA